MTGDSPAGFLVWILKGVLGVDPERIAAGSRGASEATPPESVESRYPYLFVLDFGYNRVDLFG